MASMVAVAVGVPMAMGADADTSATVGNVAPTVVSVSVSPDPVTMNTCSNTTPYNSILNPEFMPYCECWYWSWYSASRHHGRRCI